MSTFASSHRDLQLEVGLHVHPKLRRRLKQLGEAQRRIGGDTAFPRELVKPNRGYPEVPRCRRLRHAERLEKLLDQDLARRQ